MEKVILVADCGSTSCEWRLIEVGTIIELPPTAGYNPTYEAVENLGREIDGNRELRQLAESATQVFYYGAGCASKDSADKVQSLLQTKFPKALVEVHSDILGAARAVYDGKPVICGILGTGSNACLYNGKDIEFATPSLGFILGDEGSGNHIGRLLLQSYFYRTMPIELRTKLESQFEMNLGNLLKSVYQNPNASGYLAQFARFAKESIKHSFVHDMVSMSMHSFLKHFVCAFPDFEKIQFGAVGSIAFHFREVLQSEAEKLNVTMGPVMPRPIVQLAEYHLQNY